MWIAADELQDAMAIYAEELRRGGARAIETQRETEGGSPRLRCEMSDGSGNFIVVIPSATLVPMCMSLLPLLRSPSDPEAVRGLLSDQLMGLWSEVPNRGRAPYRREDWAGGRLTSVSMPTERTAAPRKCEVAQS